MSLSHLSSNAPGGVRSRFSVRHILSHEAGPFWQFVKYGVIGVASTGVQLCVFYTLAATILQCLGTDDWAVRFLGLPSVELTDGVRSIRFIVATAIGFTISNVFCWIMNRLFVFRPGRYRWYVEFLFFFGAAAVAMIIALSLSSALIRWTGLMTTLAAIAEVVISFLLNFFLRKYIIFKG